MIRRIALGASLFAMGAYTSVSFLVDEWEGRRCWDLGSQTYDRLPFEVAFMGAWKELLKYMAQGTTLAIIAISVYTAFLLAVLAILIAPRPLVTITAFMAVGLPFALTVYEKMALGLDPYCDGHGESALGVIALFGARRPISLR